MKIKVNEQEFDVQDEIITQSIEKKTPIEIKDETVQIFKSDDFNTRIENIKKDTAKEARKTQEEVIWKETKRKLGLEIDTKNGDEILDAFRQKVLSEAKIEPSKKITDLEGTVKQLQINLQKAETDKTELANQFSQKEKEAKVNSLIFQLIPEKAVTETTTRNDISILFKGNGYAIDFDNDIPIVKFNGETMKHPQTLAPLNPNDVMNKFVTDKGLLKNEGGRGAGDSTPVGTPGTLDAFEKEMTAKGFKYGSLEYNKEMKERIANKTLKI